METGAGGATRDTQAAKGMFQPGSNLGDGPSSGNQPLHLQLRHHTKSTSLLQQLHYNESELGRPTSTRSSHQLLATEGVTCMNEIPYDLYISYETTY
jgi:hypothetical protein